MAGYERVNQRFWCCNSPVTWPGWIEKPSVPSFAPDPSRKLRMCARLVFVLVLAPECLLYCSCGFPAVSVSLCRVHVGLTFSSVCMYVLRVWCQGEEYRQQIGLSQF